MKPLPKVGYHYAPACMEALTAKLRITPSAQLEPTFSKRKVNSGTYHKVAGFGKCILFSTNTLKDSWHLGDELLANAGIGLYNASDLNPENPSHRKLAAHFSNLLYRIQDSGGFQLLSGASDFVVPERIAAAHNAFADSGVTLELPSSTEPNIELVEAAARMMVANSETLLAVRGNNPWKLMNVSHGLTPKHRLAWQKIAFQKPLDSLCIAGLRGSVDSKDVGSDVRLSAIHLLIALLSPTQYQHYHLLGVSNTQGMILAALAAHLHQKTITSDASTWLNGQQFLRFLPHSDFTSIMNYPHLPCACIVCREVESPKLMRLLPYLISYHNCEFLVQTSKRIDFLAKKCVEQKFEPMRIVNLFIEAGYLKKAAAKAMVSAVDIILNTPSYEKLKTLSYKEPKPVTNPLFKPTQASTPPSRSVTIIKAYEDHHKKSFFK